MYNKARLLSSKENLFKICVEGKKFIKILSFTQVILLVKSQLQIPKY